MRKSEKTILAIGMSVFVILIGIMSSFGILMYSLGSSSKKIYASYEESINSNLKLMGEVSYTTKGVYNFTIYLQNKNVLYELGKGKSNSPSGEYYSKASFVKKFSGKNYTVYYLGQGYLDNEIHQNEIHDIEPIVVFDNGGAYGEFAGDFYNLNTNEAVKYKDVKLAVARYIISEGNLGAKNTKSWDSIETLIMRSKEYIKKFGEK